MGTVDEMLQKSADVIDSLGKALLAGETESGMCLAYGDAGRLRQGVKASRVLEAFPIVSEGMENNESPPTSPSLAGLRK